MHKYFGIYFIRADQTGRAFRWSAHLHKKAGFLRAGVAGETSRAEGVGRGMLNDGFLRPDGAVVMLSLSQANTNISFGCACHRLIQMVLRGVC